MTVRGLAAAAAAVLALAGCGSRSKPALTGPQRQGLLTRISLIRQSAVAGDLPTTQRRLRGFERAVADLQRAGALNARTAAALIAGASRSLQRAPTDVHPAVVPEAQPTPPGQGGQLPPGQAKKLAEQQKKQAEQQKKHDKHGEGGD